MDEIQVPVHSYHLHVSNRDWVLDSIERAVRPYGYFPVIRPEDVPADAARYRFYMSGFTKGWISVTDSGWFAPEDLARRLSQNLPGKVLYCWAEPLEAWGYQYYDEGQLYAELVSDMLELHREWFEEEPTAEMASRFSGNLDYMKQVFGRVGFSLREMQDILALPKEKSLDALRGFGRQLQIEDAGLCFDTIDTLPVEQRLGVRGFSVLDYYQRYDTTPDAEDDGEGDGGAEAGIRVLEE